MNWKDHIENLKSESVVSAAKAIDYLDGKQLEHTIKDLDHPEHGIKHWKRRGVIPIVNNITEKIITRSALTYQKEPDRAVYIGETENEAASQLYAEMLGYHGAVAVNRSDMDARLLKTCLIIVQYSAEQKKLLFNVLHRGNCDVDFDLSTQEVKSLLYTAGGVGMNGGQLLHFWDTERIVDLELTDNGGIRVVGTEANPYGMIPVAVRYDVSPPRSGFWPKNRWDELIRANEIVNRFHTEVAHASHVQMFPALFTNASIPDGTVVGADAIVELEGSIDDIYLEYKAPVINLEPFQNWMISLQEDLADNWGVNLKLGGEGSADSGFKLMVEETWNLELRKQRQKAAKVTERELFNVIKVISNRHSLGLPDNAELYVDFAEPQLAVDTASEREQDRNDVAAGLTSREEVWRKNDPDLTEQDIERRKQEIDGMRLPDFANVTDG